MPQYYSKYGIIQPLPSSRSCGLAHGRFASTLREPTDPLFYGNLTMENVVTGSRYWIAQASDLSNVLATGVAGSSTVTLSNLPAYSSPMLVEIRVRKNTPGDTRYLPFTTYANLIKAGATAYIAQVQDTIAT